MTIRLKTMNMMMSKEDGDLILKKIDKKDLKDIDITVKDGKKEIIIKTK